jgi:GT2 family glycosyltransferase
LYRTIDLRHKPPTSRAVDRGEAATSPDATGQSANPHGIAFITPVKDETQYRICLQYLDALEVPPGYTVEKIAVFGGSSIAQVYQQAMDACTARYKIYLHVDGYVVHRGVLSELLNLFKTYPRLGLVGVEGATKLPPDVLYSKNNPFHIYGRIWNYRRPGGPSTLLGPANRRRLHFSRFRGFVGDYLPAATVDGFFMATQYDIPWVHPQFGFDLYETVQATEFIKAGLEVGLARQETIWCIHWGPLNEPSRAEQRRRQVGIQRKAVVFRNLYPEFIGVPVRKLYERYRGAAGRIGLNLQQFGEGAPEQGIVSGGFTPPSVRERLSVVIVTRNARETLLHTMRSLLPQCAALQEIDCGVVVVDGGSTDGTVEAVRMEFPQVTTVPNASRDGLAHGLNVGLRHAGVASYILVMDHPAELAPGTLTRMVSYLRTHQQAAGVVASHTHPNGPIPSQRLSIVELIPHLLRRPRVASFVGTSCALVRADVFLDVGLYDERLKVHHVALEWSIRAKRKGYEFTFRPEARVIYQEDSLSRRDGLSFAEHLAANQWLIYKHAGRRWAVVLYWAQRLWAKWLSYRWRHDSEALQQLHDAVARMDDVYRRSGEENRRPASAVLEPSWGVGGNRGGAPRQPRL